MLLALLLAPSGCFLFGQSQATNTAHADSGAALRQDLEQRYEAARSGDPQKVVHFAAYLSGVLSNPDSKKAHGDIAWDEMTAGTLELVDKVIAEAPDESTKLQAAATKSTLLIAVDRREEAIAPVRSVHDEAPSYATAVAVLGMHRYAQIPMEDPEGFCKEHRKLAQADVQIHDFMQACAEVHPASTVQEALAWAPEKDHEIYLAVEQQLQAEAEARYQEEQRRRQEEEEARRQAMAQSAASSSSSASSPSAAPSGPRSVSVSLKNNCRQSVKLFFGDKPKFGSGTYSSIGSNTRSSRSLMEGDMIWIVDDSQNGLSSITVGANTRDIEILDSCTGFRVR